MAAEGEAMIVRFRAKPGEVVEGVCRTEFADPVGAVTFPATGQEIAFYDQGDRVACRVTTKEDESVELRVFGTRNGSLSSAIRIQGGGTIEVGEGFADEANLKVGAEEGMGVTGEVSHTLGVIVITAGCELEYLPLADDA